MVVSLGVLHHTNDTRGGLAHIQQFARPGGSLYVGLYHEPGRRVFLDHFRGLVESEGEEAAFTRYRELDHARAADERVARRVRSRARPRERESG